MSRQNMMEQIPDQAAGKKISLMIIGAQKAGTTSMKNYLGQHPSLEAHPHKEFSYFFDAAEHNKGLDAALRKYYHDSDESIRLIAKNAGLYVSESGIKRLKDHNPACKLVLILRNPVERTYSSYLMEKNYGAINGTFESIEPVVRKGDTTDWRYEFFIGMSLYQMHLSMIYKHFPKDQVMIIRYEDFKSRSGAICQELFKWLDVDAEFMPDTETKYNVTHVNRSPSYGRLVVQLLRNQNPVKKLFRKILPGKMDYKVGEMLRNINKTSKLYARIPENMSKLLTEFYAPHNDKLGELTGIDFSDWNKLKK
ncbi:MAG: sulfotransferase domain-containing protein [Bacteroidota bacterium]|nr:sulfotransferase domain-containing protein [Bacteroidota bacterium]